MINVGQGALACSDFIGTSPGDGQAAPTMTDITAQTALTVGGGGSWLDWSIGNAALEADIVVVADPNGNKCIYQYANDAREGAVLTPSGKKGVRARNVTVCSDGVKTDPPPPPPPPPAPITTINGDCSLDPRTAKLQAALNDGDLGESNAIDAIVGFGEDENGDFTLAVCSDQAEGGQVQCGACVRPDGYPDTVGKHSPQCEADLLALGVGPNGELPLSCRPCELSSLQPDGPVGTNLPDDAKNCWEYHMQVQESAPGVGTFIPSQAIDETAAVMTRYEGSSCYQIRINFYGREYIYFMPTPGCPGN
jgi:hypothetical protein